MKDGRPSIILVLMNALLLSKHEELSFASTLIANQINTLKKLESALFSPDFKFKGFEKLSISGWVV